MATRLTTRERVKNALDIAETARADHAVDDAVQAGSAMVETDCRRTFRPLTATYRFDWPTRNGSTAFDTVWFDQHDLITATTVTTGDETWTASDFWLEPVNSGPPFTHIRANYASNSAFSTGDSGHQNSLAIEGLWGHSNTERPAGALAANLATAATTATVTDGSTIGVGDLLRAGTERLWVTGRSWADTGQTLGSALTANVADRSLTVADGTAFTETELLLIGAETVRVESISGNTLICRRGWDGSVLASHSMGAAISASRLLTVERGVLGTTAAAHDDTDLLVAHVPPPLATQLATAYALVELNAARAAYAAASGSGDTEADTGGAVGRLRDRCIAQLGRKARFRSV